MVADSLELDALHARVVNRPARPRLDYIVHDDQLDYNGGGDMTSPKEGKDVIAEALPISEAKTRFSELARRAAMGLEVVSANKHGAVQPVSLIKTAVLTAALAAMRFTLAERRDDELGILTISVKEVPIYGEGHSREEAIESLVDAALDYSSVYEDRIELFSRVDSPETQAHMLKIIRCRGDRGAVRQVLGL